MLRKMYEREFEAFHQLLEENFPKGERRPKSEQKNLLSLEAYNVYVEVSEGDIVGFFAEWSNDEFHFIEHLAVNEKFRGKGTGSRLLKEYLDLDNKPVILEVEPPEDDIQKKRVRFYEKNGCLLTPFTYTQPTLYEGEPSVELVLMSYPDMLSQLQFEHFKKWALNTIYYRSEK